MFSSKKVDPPMIVQFPKYVIGLMAVLFVSLAASCSASNEIEVTLGGVEPTLSDVEANLRGTAFESLTSQLEKLNIKNSESSPKGDSLQTSLKKMAERDELLRTYFNLSYAEKDEKPEVHRQIILLTRKYDVFHASELDKMLEEHGWIDSKRFGYDAEQNAWIIAQHMVHDGGMFQRRVLDIMIANSDSDRATIALLADRIAAIFDQSPQVYGSQGSCGDDGVWRPTEISNLDELDSRRISIGLEPHETYTSRMNKFCETKLGL